MNIVFALLPSRMKLDLVKQFTVYIRVWPIRVQRPMSNVPIF